MLYKTTIGLLAIACFYANPFVSYTVAAPSVPITEASVNVMVAYYSDLYGSDYNLVMSVLDCESDFRMVSGDGGRSFGIGQFSKETFARHSKLLGESLDYYSKHDQAKLVSYIYSLGRNDLMREWSTYVAIERGGEYSFWSSVNNRHYTVQCSYQQHDKPIY